MLNWNEALAVEFWSHNESRRHVIKQVASFSKVFLSFFQKPKWPQFFVCYTLTTPSCEFGAMTNQGDLQSKKGLAWQNANICYPSSSVGPAGQYQMPAFSIAYLPTSTPPGKSRLFGLYSSCTYCTSKLSHPNNPNIYFRLLKGAGTVSPALPNHTRRPPCQPLLPTRQVS